MSRTLENSPQDANQMQCMLSPKKDRTDENQLLSKGWKEENRII